MVSHFSSCTIIIIIIIVATAVPSLTHPPLGRVMEAMDLQENSYFKNMGHQMYATILTPAHTHTERTLSACIYTHYIKPEIKSC